MLAEALKLVAILLLGIPAGMLFDKVVPNSPAQQLLDMVGNPNVLQCLFVFLIAVILFAASIHTERLSNPDDTK